MTLNFVPEMPRQELIQEYRRVISTLYDPTLKNYFARCLKLLEHMPKTQHNVRSINMNELGAFMQVYPEAAFLQARRRVRTVFAKVLKRLSFNVPGSWSG